MSVLNSIKVSKRHPFIGAEVPGVDLRTTLDEDAFD